MMNFDIKITEVDNGYILEWQDEIDEKEIIVHKEVYSSNECELECMKKVLIRIKEYFGMFYSKHENKNLIIEVKE